MLEVKTSGLQVQLYSPLLPNLLRRLRAATRGLPYPRLECFDVEERPGRRDRRIRARAGPLQVKRVVCVRRLVMALHKRGGLQGGLFGWVSRGSLRMFKMYGRTSWSIKRPRSVVSEAFDTFWFCHRRIQEFWNSLNPWQVQFKSRIAGLIEQKLSGFMVSWRSLESPNEPVDPWQASSDPWRGTRH